MNNLYIIGFMGSGKTSLASELDKISENKKINVDALIEKKLGMSISEIFAIHGEAFFRKHEHELLSEISKHDNQIVDCGGGLPLTPENRKLIKTSGRCIYLKVSPNAVLQRLKSDESRPLLENKKSIKEISLMLDKRVPFYESIADISIETDNFTTKEIAEKLIPYL
ncbi:shikimate kinase [Eubacterium infirmum F0142]|nr:shikimate kinase [Eubacterium infirmum F0142]